MRLFYPALAVLGLVLVVFACLMLLPVIVLWHAPNHAAFLKAAFTTGLIGAVLLLRFRGTFEVLRAREVFLVTVLAWVGACVAGALPLLAASPRLSMTDAVFESVSGVTTTGSTILTGLDAMPTDILLWRSLLQWIGGIGIIGMAVAVLPFLSVGGMRLFRSESSDMSDKALPRIRALVARLLGAYVALSLLCALCYWLGGMSFFDAVNHAMTTVSTGGYATSDRSMGQFAEPALHWVAVVFMVLGSVPFALYVSFWSEGQWRVFEDRQVQFFLALLAAVALLLAVELLAELPQLGLFEALTLAAFNVTSVMTTTGYATADYTTWGTAAGMLFLFLTFVGGCSGSTSGGMKIFRLQLSFMLLREQIRKLVHPQAVFRRRYNDSRVSDEVVASMIAFSFLFFISIVVIALLLGLLGLDAMTCLSGAVTALANVGPGLGEVIGPAGTFQDLPAAAKWILCAGMLLGRLELLTVIALFTRDFWRG